MAEKLELVVTTDDFSPGLDEQGNRVAWGYKIEDSAKIRFTWPPLKVNGDYLLRTNVPNFPGIPFDARVKGYQIAAPNPQTPGLTAEMQAPRSFEDLAKYPVVAVYEVTPA